MKIFENKTAILLMIVAFVGLTYWIYTDTGFSDVFRVGDIKKIIPAGEDFEVEVSNGNIIKKSGKKEEILIDKKDYEQISEFIRVWVSPDKNRICFLGQSMVPVWVHISDIDGINVVKVDTGKNCSFSPDSNKIAYNTHTTDVSPVDVRLYDILTSEKSNLTSSFSTEEIYRVYNTPTWINDIIIESEYEEINFSDFTNKRLGISEINIETGKVTDR
ncbi:hypothetical protein KKG08_01615 [Patescibacteria group bacterium]|nr:hypothetical protein [Patescibacteria group bacterium]